MDYTIRAFRDGDAPALREATLAAIRTIGARAYSPEQVAEWAAGHADPERLVIRAADGAIILAASDKIDRPVAYALLEQESQDSVHLDMLYCHPDHAGRGLADALLEKAEQRARDRGARRLFTEASELARPVLERAGYRTLHRRDFDIVHRGRKVAIHNFAMEKRLG